MEQILLPEFWKSELKDLDELIAIAKKAEVRSLAKSAGGRDVWCFSYGEREEIKSSANYNSACGAHDYSSHLNLEGKKPVFLIIGGIHGQETEGIISLMNFISVLETGVDLAGQRQDDLLAAVENTRLLIIPIANPDGRARVKLPSMVGVKGEVLRYWGQGTWKDGTLCSWPGCKKVHPILEAVEFLGGYFNDDGINLMHDQFFSPMASETEAILNLVQDEYVDCVMQLHGGSNSVNDLLHTAYAPLEHYQASKRLSERCHEVALQEGLAFHVRAIPEMANGFPPPSFNLTSSIHHVGGALSMLFESNQCIVDEPGTHYNHEQIYRSHFILFEEMLNMFKVEPRGYQF